IMSRRIAPYSRKPTESFKVITIRELDKELFEQFTSLTKTWGKNVGEIFSRILENFLEIGSTNIFMPSFEERLKQMNCTYLEVIENLDELTIQKQDLISLPKGVKLYFYNIKRLIFSEDINTPTLLDYVFRIKNSAVIPPKNIQKLLYLSLFQNSSEYIGKNRKIKDVTIRNVDNKTWNDFIAHCQLNISKASVVINRILWEIIPEMEITQILISKIKEPLDNILVVTSQKNVSINQEDLQKIADKKVLFHRIEELILDEDISQEVFVEKVLGIYNCKKITFPKGISKLLQLSRVKEYPSRE
ncbi:MAG: hypothetical protein ACTSPK_06885, partial [Candidatus Heimdallarchaeota archaeon]